MIALKELLVPPCGLVVLALIALAFSRRYARSARWIMGACVAGLYVLSMPMTASLLLQSLQPAYVDPRNHKDVQAIVLLGGGTAGYAEEYGADIVNSLSLVRLRYAARLHRATGLPLLVSGGSVLGDTAPEAEQIRAVLTGEMGVPVRWTEAKSVDTLTNALETARILKQAGITRVFLVTHAWHIPRARLSFAHAGLDVIPAPTGFQTFTWRDMVLADVLPRASAFLNSYYFFHEAIGYAVYRLRTRS